MDIQERIVLLERKTIELEAQINLLNHRSNPLYPTVYPTYPAPQWPTLYWYTNSKTDNTIRVGD